MKRILLLIIIQLLYIQTAFAMSLAELQSEPNRYTNYKEVQSSTLYVDLNSIQALRNAHPYYTLKAKIHFVSYASDSIIEVSETYNYNYNQSFDSLVNKALQLYPTYSDDKITDWIFKEAEKNSEITIGSTSIKCYNLDGKHLNDGKPSYTKNVEFFTNEFFVASFIYNKYYAMKFWDA